MSNFHSAYSLETEQYLPNYTNREDGRKLVREIIRDLIEKKIETTHDPEQLKKVVPEWASAHPIALLEQEFGIEIRQHEDQLELENPPG